MTGGVSLDALQARFDRSGARFYPLGIPEDTENDQG
jgi:hypothetical protein